MKVWFATPCFGRFEITDVCLAQRAHLRDELAGHGIEFNCVVVADDENLAIAETHGFPTLERPNDFLSDRWNDGFVYACEQGADYVAPVDSDCFVHADYLTTCTFAGAVQSGNVHAQVASDGARLIYRDVWHPFALGPMCLPRRILDELDGRPIEAHRKSGVSTSIYNRMRAAFPVLPFEFVNVHDLQYVGLRSAPSLQITRQERTRWDVLVRDDPFGRLLASYPEALVEQARAAYAHRPRPSARARAQARRGR